MFYTVVTILWFLSLAVAARLTNVTIDDTIGDQITYAPAQYWNYGPTCTVCAATPDVSETHNNTWHDTAYYPPDNFAPTAELTFTGVAVYVYGILRYDNPSLRATDLTFLIDGELVGNYSQPDSSKKGWEYSALLFSHTSLSSKQHNLTIQNGVHQGKDASVLLLDYIVYSQLEDDAQSSPSTTPSTQAPNSPTNPVSQSNEGSRSNTAAIIGGVIGALVALSVVGALVFLCLRRRRTSADSVSGPQWGSSVPFTAQAVASGVCPAASAVRGSDISFKEFSFQPLTSPTYRTDTSDTISTAGENGSSYPAPQPDTEKRRRQLRTADAVSLVDEVRRLRDENSRLQSRIHDEQPPPPY